MSRLGRLPLPLPAGVEAGVAGSVVTVRGPKGQSSLTLPPALRARVDGRQLIVERTEENRAARSAHGLQRGLLANMVEGVRVGYSRSLEIQGVGFKAELKGRSLALSLGFSSPKEFVIPEGVDVKVDGGTKMLVSGIDKQKVGEVAARIRA